MCVQYSLVCVCMYVCVCFRGDRMDSEILNGALFLLLSFLRAILMGHMETKELQQWVYEE